MGIFTTVFVTVRKEGHETDESQTCFRYWFRCYFPTTFRLFFSTALFLARSIFHPFWRSAGFVLLRDFCPLCFFFQEAQFVPLTWPGDGKESLLMECVFVGHSPVLCSVSTDTGKLETVLKINSVHSVCEYVNGTGSSGLRMVSC